MNSPGWSEAQPGDEPLFSPLQRASREAPNPPQISLAELSSPAQQELHYH
jgi:hypothetical protein